MSQEISVQTSNNQATKSLTNKLPKVLIIGAGFAGLNAAKALAPSAVEITLIDRRNHHTFQPLLYQVATATLSPANIAQPIRRILSQYKNIRVLLDEVASVDMAAKQAHFKELGALDFDYLILATGAKHSYFGNEQWEKFAPGLKTIEDAIEIRSRILAAFENAENEMAKTGSHKPLNFIVIGGGPTGVEMAGAIADICRISMRGDYRFIDPTKSRIILIEGLPRILGPYPEDLSSKALAQLKDMGVEVLLSTTVTDVRADSVSTKSGGAPGAPAPANTSATPSSAPATPAPPASPAAPAKIRSIPASVVVWAAGVQASSASKLLGAELDRRGCVIVDQFLNPPGFPYVFVCGDVAHFEQNGKPVPGVAPCAMQMGQHAASEIACDLAGKKRQAFHYSDKGDMATIGRRRAVANLHWPIQAHMSGYIAWLSWLVIHILSLIGLRNRLAVFFEWLWTYYSSDRGVRLITVDPPDYLSAEPAEAQRPAEAKIESK